jgi:hypothetical protein
MRKFKNCTEDTCSLPYTLPEKSFDEEGEVEGEEVEEQEAKNPLRPPEKGRSIAQVAEAWGKGHSTIRRWIVQKRLTFIRPAHEYLILDEDPPKPAKQGDLTPEQRKAWKK